LEVKKARRNQGVLVDIQPVVCFEGIDMMEAEEGF